MRLLVPISLIASCVAAIWSIAAQDSMGVASRVKDLLRERDGAIFEHSDIDLAHGRNNTYPERLLAIEPYEDLDYGFKVAIPTGWRKIVTADSVSAPTDDSASNADSVLGNMQEPLSDVVPASLEPGYAVGFESVQQDENDRFADYILIEILPGGESGRFEADQSLRQPVTIDGRNTWFDRLEIDQVSSGLIDVDLVVYQAELSGVGYTVGLYAIGEPVREQLLAVAFAIMLQTFELLHDPFAVS